MYTKADLSVDLKDFEMYTKIVNENLIDLKKYIKEKQLDIDFFWKVNETQIMLNNYKEVANHVKLQDIYSADLDSQSEELIDRLKKTNAEHCKQKDEFESLAPILNNYSDIADGLKSSFDSLDNLMQISVELKNELIKTTSAYMINNKILPPQKDEEFEYVDIFLNIMMNIDNENLQRYLTELDKKLEEIEAEETEENFSYVESGVENFEINTEKNNDGYEELEDILKTMKKNSRGF